MDYIKAIEKIYLREQKNKILDLARDLYHDWEITLNQLQDTYFLQFMKKSKIY